MTATVPRRVLLAFVLALLSPVPAARAQESAAPAGALSEAVQ
ncbi:MAG TPA: hypothetical protein VFK70_03285 [Vicinamibacteria bacterium]|nr:hypothetical protein [Vicinamibacteria bacterium]